MNGARSSCSPPTGCGPGRRIGDRRSRRGGLGRPHRWPGGYEGSRCQHPSQDRGRSCTTAYPAGDATAVAATYRLIAERAGASLEGVLVEEMLDGNREFLAGLKRDPSSDLCGFWPRRSVDRGVGRRRACCAPLSARDVAELPDLIRAREAARGFPRRSPGDRGRLEQVIAALGQIASDFPEISEIDINPLIVAGDRPVAADALVILASDRTSAPTARAFAPDLRAVFAPDSIAIIGANDDIRNGAAPRFATSSTAATPGRSTRSTRGWGLLWCAGVFEPGRSAERRTCAACHRGSPGPERAGRSRKAGSTGPVVLTAGFSETGAEARPRSARYCGWRPSTTSPSSAQLHGIVVQRGAASRHRAGRPASSVGKLSFISHREAWSTVINMCQRRASGSTSSSAWVTRRW